jgi:hypothetical protein
VKSAAADFDSCVQRNDSATTEEAVRRPSIAGYFEKNSRDDAGIAIARLSRAASRQCNSVIFISIPVGVADSDTKM